MENQSAHVRWLLAESKRLDAVIAEGKRARKLKTEINKMIALYGEVEPGAQDVVNGVVDVDNRISCTECLETFTTKARVGQHLRKDHNVWGGLSGRQRPESRKSTRKVRAA